MPRKWQRMGSPTSTVLVERFGSLRVHCRSVPAGRTTSRASANGLSVRTTRPSRANAGIACGKVDFILHLGRLPQSWRAVVAEAANVSRIQSWFSGRVNQELPYLAPKLQ